ncbi:MAG: hypothetical protein PHS92_02145 [Candidatus Gracilibacteria bacterium]|nr:hypothetical protein [Candidatus Gracilibacteria bacterium]
MFKRRTAGKKERKGRHGSKSEKSNVTLILHVAEENVIATAVEARKQRVITLSARIAPSNIFGILFQHKKNGSREPFFKF